MKTYRTKNKIKRDIIKTRGPMVIIGKNNRELNEIACRLYKNMRSISVLNLDNLSASNKYNPFAYIKTDTDVEKAAETVLNATDSLFSEKDAHKASEIVLLQALILYLRDNDEISKEFKNFSSVIKLLKAADADWESPDGQSSLDKLFAKVEDEDPNSLAVKQYKIFKLLPMYEQKITASGLAERLLAYSLPEIAEITGSDTMDLKSFPSSNRVIILVYGNTSRNHLIKLFLRQLSDIVKVFSNACSVSVFSLLNSKKYILSHKTDVKENFLNTAADTSKAAAMYTSKSQTFDQAIKSNEIKNSRKAADRITLKKGETIVNEKENAETGKIEFDYDI